MNEFFKALQPSPRVIQFLEKYPHPTWKDCLRFLLQMFPQMVNGQPSYLIEGGVAVMLQTGVRQDEPQDVDFITFDGFDASEFQNSRYFGAETVDVFFESRGIHTTSAKKRLIQNHFLTVVFEGSEVHTLSPELLALSKKISSRTSGPREKDQRDLKLLDISEETVEALLRRLTEN